jgi:ribulose-bisphosphate carboxylase small chain
MRLTQGTFSHLPDLGRHDIRAQVQYAIDHGWAIAVEYTNDPHPRNAYWDLWGLPTFDLEDADRVLDDLDRCGEAFPSCYVKVSAYDAHLGRQTTALSFIVQRPREEAGFRLERQETNDRQARYTLRPNRTRVPLHDSRDPRRPFGSD